MLKRAAYEQKVSVDRLASVVRGALADAHGASDGQVLEACQKTVLTDEEAASLRFRDKAALVRKVFCTLRCELEILQDLADDPQVTEIMVNGCRDIFVERESRTEKTDLYFESPERLQQVIQRLAARVGREINDLNPIVDARLSDGSRINAVHSSIAIGGPILTIRKFGKERLTMERLIENGDLTEEAAEFLDLMVRCGYNIFISGGTSSGKTTFLNILSDRIPRDERIVVIEDSAELQIRGHANLVRLEARAAGSRGSGGVPMEKLIKTSLRMRPDRIIVGEVRGEEVIDMLAAMSTGHDGSLSTGHANSTAGMLVRLETMARTGSDVPSSVVRTQIAEGIDLMVHLARTRDGHRRVIEISELCGVSGERYEINPLFIYRPRDGLVHTGNRLRDTYKLIMKGGEEEYEGLQIFKNENE
ncbi:MAG: CpaF family protein [Firmicutes bacterium]|nr:CpaF family protein [Bacillota bacterium]